MEDDTTQLRSRLVEAVFACVAVLVLCAVVLAADRPGSSSAAFLLVAGFGALAVLGGRLPRTALALTVFGIFAYYAAGFPPLGMVLPATGALYLAAARERTRWAVGGAVVLLAVATYYRVADSDPAAGFTGYEYVTEVALAAAAIALGAAMRSARQLRRQATRIAELVAAEQTLAAEQRMAEQRIRIARELHDTVGHRLTVVSLHAAVAQEALTARHTGPRAVGEREAEVRIALERVREANAEALRELRAAVRLLRQQNGGPSGDPLGIDGLARTAREAGLRVDIESELGELPLEIVETARRILTEAVTNVLRHARASKLCIAALDADGWLRLEVTDDGTGSSGGCDDAPSGSGSGIAGMRERAALAGGSLELRSATGGGFAVIARLPLRTTPASAGAEGPSEHRTGHRPGARAADAQERGEETR